MSVRNDGRVPVMQRLWSFSSFNGDLSRSYVCQLED